MSVKTLLPLLLAGALAAHDLYLRPETFQPAAGQTLRVEFHNGDRFPNSEVTVKIERLRDAQIAAGAQRAALENLRIEGTATVADAAAPAAGLFTLSARTVPNFIELAASKFEEYLRHEGLDSIIEWRRGHGESSKPGRETYSKYVKALGYVGAPTGAFDQPAGLTHEFIALANPYRLAPGQALPVRLLFRGQPQPGLMIELSHASPDKVTKRHVGRTNAKGEIDVPLTGAGLWKLHTILMERAPQGQSSDWQSFWASLTFETAAR